MVFLTIALFQSAQSTLIESFSNDDDDDDVNENGKKAIGLGYVRTMPHSFCASTKTTPDSHISNRCSHYTG